MSGPIPVLVIRTSDPNRRFLKEIMAGIEEEGVLYEVVSRKDRIDAVTLAYQAAKASSLGVGIGICEDRIRLAVREQLSPTLIPQKDAPRTIGHNGARFIKKKPLR